MFVEEKDQIQLHTVLASIIGNIVGIFDVCDILSDSH